MIKQQQKGKWHPAEPHIDTHLCLILCMQFPEDYPSSAPHIVFLTTNGGKTRFNPNLYSDGKVCLSILGTWRGESGEQWSSVQNCQVSVFLCFPCGRLRSQHQLSKQNCSQFFLVFFKVFFGLSATPRKQACFELVERKLSGARQRWTAHGRAAARDLLISPLLSRTLSCRQSAGPCGQSPCIQIDIFMHKHLSTSECSPLTFFLRHTPPDFGLAPVAHFLSTPTNTHKVCNGIDPVTYG